MNSLLAVDVGGTKADLGIFDLTGRILEPSQHRVMPCAGYSGIEEIIRGFLDDTGLRPDFICLGVAGIIDDGKARITNLPWHMDERGLAEEFSLKGAKLINDMTALGAVLSSLASDDLQTLQQGEVEKEGTRAVIAPGTGLGEGYLIETEAVFLPCGSEGGHADFAPVNDEQQQLLAWMSKRSRPVSYEMLCSGLGIPALYDFCKEHGAIAETAVIAKRLQETIDKTPVIVDGAIADEPCPLCRRTMELFLSILGSEAGNLALKLYARGGLYIGGGLMPRLAGKLSFAPFIEAFRRKQKMEELMAKIPVHLILKRDAVLSGAAVYGRRYFGPQSGRGKV